MQFERYAIYYAPEAGSQLHHFGAKWLGWDPEAGIAKPRPVLQGFPAQDIALVTRAPSRYGFHGTLKPPFRLKAGTGFDQLDQELCQLAKRLSAFSCGLLKIKQLGFFLALAPKDPELRLPALAEQCVRQLDMLRAPLNKDELARRRQKNLSPRQEELLEKWGYPYVLDQLRFHLTLTDNLDADRIDFLFEALRKLTAPLGKNPFSVSEICLFGDPGTPQPFRLIKRYPLGGGHP